MALHSEQRMLILVLCISGCLFGTSVARSLTWTDPQLLFDQSPVLHNPINDEVWHDSVEAPDRDNHIYPSLSKSKLQALQEKLPWHESAENVKRWLNNHFKPSNLNSKSDYLDSDVYGQNQQVQQAKRNGGGYMCHFKLCQLGASNSGKRRWNPSAFD